MSILECVNLSVGYDKEPIAEDINFTVCENDYLIIVGENGAGKSTLLKTLLKLESPISGEINFFVERNEIGYLPQSSEHQNDFPATVFEIVLSGLINKKGKLFFNKSDKQIALNNIKKLNIEDLKNKSYKTLSGGQKQRVLLARALCSTSKIIFLDEPTTGLDPVATQDLYVAIEELNKEGLAIVMISHDVNEAIKYANKVLKLGKTTKLYTKEEYLGGE